MSSYTVAQALAKRLEQIKASNGYHTDAGYNVAIGWRSIGQGESLPALTVTCNGATPDDGGARLPGPARMLTEWTVEGVLETGDNALEAMDQLAEDILRAVNEPADVLGGAADGLMFAGQTYTGPQPGSILAVVAVNFITVAQRRFGI